MHTFNAPYLHIFISVQALIPKMNPRGGWALFFLKVLVFNNKRATKPCLEPLDTLEANK